MFELTENIRAKLGAARPKVVQLEARASYSMRPVRDILLDDLSEHPAMALVATGEEVERFDRSRDMTVWEIQLGQELAAEWRAERAKAVAIATVVWQAEKKVPVT